MPKLTSIIPTQSDAKSRIRYMLKREMDGYIYEKTTAYFKTMIYDVKLREYKYMTDPVALFRPQTLYGWYGTVKHIPSGQVYQVFFITGTDEGMLDADVIVEPTEEDIKRVLWSGWRDEFYAPVISIIPPKYK